MTVHLYEAEREEAYQEEAYDEFLSSLAEELYEEHKEQALEEFIEERLQSHYREHPDLGEKAIHFIKLSKEKIESDPTSSLIYSSIATEVILKSILIKPIVAGLVHSDSVAELIARLLVKRSGLHTLKSLIFKIYNEYVIIPGGIEGYSRKGSNKTLWEERKIIQSIRNKIMHRAELCSSAQAEQSYKVCDTFVGLTKQLLGRIGLHFKENGKIELGDPNQLSLF